MRRNPPRKWLKFWFFEKRMQNKMEKESSRGSCNSLWLCDLWMRLPSIVHCVTKQRHSRHPSGLWICSTECDPLCSTNWPIYPLTTMPTYWNDDCMPHMWLAHDGHGNAAIKLVLDRPYPKSRSFCLSVSVCLKKVPFPNSVNSLDSSLFSSVHTITKDFLQFRFPNVI